MEWIFAMENEMALNRAPEARTVAARVASPLGGAALVPGELHTAGLRRRYFGRTVVRKKIRDSHRLENSRNIVHNDLLYLD